MRITAIKADALNIFAVKPFPVPIAYGGAHITTVLYINSPIGSSSVIRDCTTLFANWLVACTDPHNMHIPQPCM